MSGISAVARAEQEHDRALARHDRLWREMRRIGRSAAGYEAARCAVVEARMEVRRATRRADRLRRQEAMRRA